MAVPFLTSELGANARIAVEIAWGADLTDESGALWVWSDITADVRFEPAVSLTGGRNDEASTSNPATCSLTLDNTSGAYSLGGQSVNYPYVRRNTPVRVRVNVDDGTGYHTLFQGYANGFTPGWLTATGKLPIVKLSASGMLRRLLQGKDPLRSALFRYFTMTNIYHSTLPVEWWPLEEDKTATVGLSGLDGGPAVFQTNADPSTGNVFGKVAWGSDTDNAATARAVSVSTGGQLSLPCRPNIITHSTWNVQWSMRYTSGSGGFVDIFATGGLVKWRIVFYTDGSVEVWEVQGGLVTTTRISGTNGQPYLWDNVWRTYTFTVDQSGGTKNWFLYGNGTLIGGYSSAAAVEGDPTQIVFQSGFGDPNEPLTVAQVAVTNGAIDPSEHAFAGVAYDGESVDFRLARLCEEQGIDLAETGTADESMGPQRPLSLVALLRECETANQGVLYDGVGAGLAYIARSVRENAATTLTTAAASLVQPFAPADDDQRNRNRMVAKSAKGGQATYEDTAGPLGTASIGIYDGSVDPNVYDSTEVINYASWGVHLGTVEGYRIPSLTLNMRAVPALKSTVVALGPSARLVITDPDTVAAMPAEDLQLLCEGTAHSITPLEWSFTAKCSPFEPWVIGTAASTTGDTDDDLLRADTDGSSLTPILVGVGASASGSNTALDPALPAGVVQNDVVLCFASIRNSGTGTPDTPSGYTLLGGTANARVFGKLAGVSESAPHVTFTGGVANATTLARTAVFRHVSLTLWAAAVEQLNGSAQNVAFPTYSGIGTSGLLIVFGWKQDDWTSVDPLVAGLVNELFELSSTTGDDAAMVVDYTLMTEDVFGGGTGSGSFTVTGGASAISRGIVLALKLADVPAGSTTLDVATPSGPLWTTTADDFPLYLDVGGTKVRATACTGSSSPQVFTVDALPTARPANALVKVWQPPALGL